jgi:hypothetical protein
MTKDVDNPRQSGMPPAPWPPQDQVAAAPTTGLRPAAPVRPHQVNTFTLANGAQLIVLIEKPGDPIMLLLNGGRRPPLPPSATPPADHLGGRPHAVADYRRGRPIVTLGTLAIIVGAALFLIVAGAAAIAWGEVLARRAYRDREVRRRRR